MTWGMKVISVAQAALEDGAQSPQATAAAGVLIRLVARLERIEGVHFPVSAQAQCLPST